MTAVDRATSRATREAGPSPGVLRVDATDVVIGCAAVRAGGRAGGPVVCEQQMCTTTPGVPPGSAATAKTGRPRHDRDGRARRSDAMRVARANAAVQ